MTLQVYYLGLWQVNCSCTCEEDSKPTECPLDSPVDSSPKERPMDSPLAASGPAPTETTALLSTPSPINGPILPEPDRGYDCVMPC